MSEHIVKSKTYASRISRPPLYREELAALAQAEALIAIAEELVEVNKNLRELVKTVKAGWRESKYR